MQISGLRGSSPAWLTSLVAGDTTCCCILADEHLVPIFEQDLRLFTERRILTYPGYEIPPYTPLSPDQQTTAARLATLYHLHQGGPGKILVTSAEALMRRVLPVAVLSRSAELIGRGEDCDQEQLRRTLQILGYEQVSLVQTVGDFSVRGGILDIFPPPFFLESGEINEGPIRLDFFGDTIESLRAFEPISQRSIAELAEATILPVHDVVVAKDRTTGSRIARRLREEGRRANWSESETEQIAEKMASGRRFAGMEFFLPLFYEAEKLPSATVFDFLPPDTTFILIDPPAINETLTLVAERIANNYAEATRLERPALAPATIFQQPDEVLATIARHRSIACGDFPTDQGEPLSLPTSGHQLLKQDIHLQRSKRGLLGPLSEQIFSWQQAGQKVILCCRSPRHTRNLGEMLTKHHHQIELIEPPLSLAEPRSPADQATLYLCTHPLAAGFSLPQCAIHLLSESELFGEMRLGGRKKDGKPRHDPLRFAELRDGDIVVHRDHGLGLYLGMTTITVQGVTNDFMQIEYRDGDRLYLPVDRLNLISRYEGLSDQQPKIDKLGTQTWRTTKNKVKAEVWKIAQELLNIYAEREMRQGRRFSPPAELFADLEESFPFDETPGQDKAISDVITDLTSDQPMDRLVCGDVGYGKTEVAIRAAFKVVEDGAQVAILVPTTVLAEQHAKTFRERLDGFPVRVECINRFRTTAQQRQIIKDLRSGAIDIIIGTHRLLSKDVQFRDLGLLVIDEEHRFGVAHKEKFKKMRAEVDILTLTATPIPRTLQMSLLSIRDLSVISSPPEHRRPVKTFIARYDDLVIKEAVSKELRRGGQIFLVHNRIGSIHKLAANVQALVPEARIAVAHGQMAGKELEEIMVGFVKRDIDVLVCTTIIESGLDIPTANTIIINRADMLGLAEIYQLRGRVGRSSTQSYAYLLVPSVDSLSKDSRDRLQALMDCNELGGGFKLSMSDLQIRGGGNLLGISQSGHIAAIGYELYLDLLQSTVADLKAQASRGERGLPVEELDPEINLQISAYIPEKYIEDISQRYIVYRRIAALSTADALAQTDLIGELTDRYGALPAETDNLFRVVELKRSLVRLRISKLEKGKDSLVFTFLNDTPISPTMIMNYIAAQTGKRRPTPPKLTPDGRLVVTCQLATAEMLFTAADAVLTSLSRELDHAA